MNWTRTSSARETSLHSVKRNAQALLIGAMCLACAFFDTVDRWLAKVGLWLPWPFSRLRCPAGLAMWSSILDERWETGVWKAVKEEERFGA